MTIEKQAIVNKLQAVVTKAQNELNAIHHERSKMDQREAYALGERTAYQTALDLIKEN